MANLERIRTLAKVKGIPLATLASNSGISEQGLYKVLRENSARVETLERIAAALGVSVCVFFDDQYSTTAELAKQNGELIEIIKGLTK